MLEPVAAADLEDQIDELSTRMILDGVAALSPADFERLSRTAAEHDNPALADVAERIAQEVSQAPTPPSKKLTQLVQSSLTQMQRLLREPTAALQSKTLAPPSVQPEASEQISSEPDPLAADENLIREFITEATEHLSTIESELLILEKDTSATEALNAVFRAFHTIKGLAGFFGFAEIRSLAHEVETLLDLARTSQIVITPAAADVVLESTDVLRQELESIAQRLAGETPMATTVDEAMLERIRSVAQGAAVESLPSVSLPLAPLGSTREISPAEEPTAREVRLQERRPGDSSSIRIHTAKLDQLMDMVGEMVIAQTLIGHSSALETVTDTTLQSNLAQLSRLTADIQRIATAMRMVPIGLQFQKTARVVRDLARRNGRQIVFETAGEDTELDKTIAEELSDPLLHMVRNSVDHGIESPEERIAKGKDPTARIRVSAYHQAGQIVVSISDDGRGLNREKILARARKVGLIQKDAQLSDSEIHALIFAPGFSTADKITDISGRGVGMDVVTKHVQKLRGRIDIESKEGEGTTFYIKLPLTLAIIEGLVVSVGQQRYIVPMFSVREMFRPPAEMLSTVYNTGEMAMVRGGLMPIVRLHRMFATEPRSTDLTNGILIVAESEGQRFCLFVDDLIGKQEVVIKSLGQRFSHVIGLAGCAILGDGRVGLILDIDGIYQGRT